VCKEELDDLGLGLLDEREGSALVDVVLKSNNLYLQNLFGKTNKDLKTSSICI
jgi:hypothetical protein